jgi:hypothetical protein
MISFFEKIQILFQFLLFTLHSKLWFKVEYLNQFPKFPDLKSPQKVYLNLS